MSAKQEYALKIISPYRKKIKPGDIFAMKFDENFYLHGRVIRTDAYWTPSGEDAGLANLVYIYRPISTTIDGFAIDQLTIENFLIPPVMTNNLGWSRGYFSTIDNVPLADSDIVERHVFRNSDKPEWFFDDAGREVTSWDGPIGVYGLASYRAIERVALDALGLLDTSK